MVVVDQDATERMLNNAVVEEPVRKRRVDRRLPEGERRLPVRRRLPIGVRLRALRDEAGLSYRKLHEYTKRVDPERRGIHPTTLNRIEVDDQTARAETALIIARALELALGRRVSIDELYSGAGPTSLNTYLEKERERRHSTFEDFASVVGLSAARYRALINGDIAWLPNDLPGVVQALPESYPLVVRTLAEHKPRRAPVPAPR